MWPTVSPSDLEEYYETSETDEILADMKMFVTDLTEADAQRHIREVWGMSPEKDGYQVFHNLVEVLLDKRLAPPKPKLEPSDPDSVIAF